MSGEKNKYIHLEQAHNFRSPNVVVPLLIEKFKPKSVLDVGCGSGTWLKVFKDNSLTIHGIDGLHVDTSKLHVSKKYFSAADLGEGFEVESKYDMAISLEVAEHLPESSAKIFIQSLTKSSEVIIFSAALPNQGGQNHLNEQPPAYWVNLFNDAAFDCFDIIRPLIWDNEEIDWWYRQNIFVAVKAGSDHAKLFLRDEAVQPNCIPHMVHPELYNYRVWVIRNIRENCDLFNSDPFDNIKPVLSERSASKI
jgi:SAM-dependent methyltransferase